MKATAKPVRTVLIAITAIIMMFLMCIDDFEMRCIPTIVALLCVVLFNVNMLLK